MNVSISVEGIGNHRGVSAAQQRLNELVAAKIAGLRAGRIGDGQTIGGPVETVPPTTHKGSAT